MSNYNEIGLMEFTGKKFEWVDKRLEELSFESLCTLYNHVVEE